MTPPMSAPRIHIPAARIEHGEAALERDEQSYLVTVLRLGGGAPVVVFDGEGREYDATLSLPARKVGARLVIGAGRPSPAPRGPAITLIQALIKNRHFDLVVRKAAELGAARVVPVRTARTVKEAHAGSGRWRAISAEASRQCGRADLMVLDDVCALDAALATSPAALKLFAWEGEGGVPLKQALDGYHGGSIAVAVGPEGGFTDAEVAGAQAVGFTPVTLGGRILRAETAPIAVLAVIQYVLGDLGGPRVPESA